MSDQTPGISFADYQTEYMRLKAQEQDLKSALYAVHPFIPEGETEPSHYIVLYPLLDQGEIEYSILDSNMMDLRLIAQVPKLVMIRAAELYKQVLDWSEGKAPYPHSFDELPSMVVVEESTIGDDLKDNLNERNSAASSIIEAALQGLATDQT